MIKVLLVTGSLHIGGMESVAMNIVRYSDKSRFHFDFVVYGDDIYENEKEAINLGCEVFRVPFPHDSLYDFDKKIRKVMRENGPYNIVHCHNLFNCGLVSRAAYLEKIPVRISHSHTNRLKKHSSYLHRVFEWYMRRLIKKYSTEYYACSEKAGEYLFGKNFSKTGHVMKNGICTYKYLIDQSIRKEYRKKLNIEKCTVIGQIGSLVPVKNHEQSLKIINNLNKSFNMNFKLVIVGSGELYDKIKKTSNDFGLENDVLMLGSRDDVPQLLSAFDIYLMPSFYEGVSIALMEAQASGLPCVTSIGACSPESEVTQQIEKVSLEDDINTWCQAILNCAEHGRYLDSYKEIKMRGYDINDIVINLNKEYELYVRNTKE